MLNVIVDNLKKGNAEGRLFEMAPVYLAKELPISEHPMNVRPSALVPLAPRRTSSPSRVQWKRWPQALT